MKMFSMFTGIGGFDLACRNLNIKIIGACEIDSYARTIYSRHFPEVRIEEDARSINPEELPDFDVLCAGFPCQSFSIAGKRGGFKDTRGTLFFEIVRIAREKQPSILLLENVKGLLSHDKGETFRIIIESLDELGYDVEWQVLNSKYFVPQNRERVFIIGHLREKPSRKILPLGEVSKRNDKSRKEQLYAKDECSSTLTATYWKGWGGGRPMIAEPKIKKVGKIHKGQSGEVYSTDGIATTILSGGGGDGAKTGLYEVSTPEPKTTMIMKGNKNSNCKNRIQDRDSTWSLTCNSNDFALTQKQRIRRLTPLECERLQGFPDNWTEGISDTQRYKCLGNAVTVPVVEYIISKFTS